jgi:hypothetical protein
VRPLALLLLVAGCVDTVKCHAPSVWPACSDATAEPGASGMPPVITVLSLPTCAFVEVPSVSGTILITDPDGDVAATKTSIYVGTRQSETDMMLPAGHMGDYSGAFSVTVPGKPGAYDVRVKAVDRAGGQSAPLCNTVTVLQ